jgi:hypothetical protein
MTRKGSPEESALGSSAHPVITPKFREQTAKQNAQFEKNFALMFPRSHPTSTTSISGFIERIKAIFKKEDNVDLESGKDQLYKES